MKQVMTVLLNVAVHVRLIVKQSFTTLCMFIETDSYNECMTDYHSCTSEQLCQYPEGGPHTCYCKPGYRMIPSGGCVAASRIPPQCKIVSGSSFLKNSRGNPLIPYERGYICTCGEKQALIDAGYSTRNSTTGEEAAARVVSRNDKYMCYCLRATVGPYAFHYRICFFFKNNFNLVSFELMTSLTGL